MNQDFPVGKLGRIRSEWCDSPAERSRVFVVVTPSEGKGRVDISPSDWNQARDGRIRPQQVVSVAMLEAAP